MKISKISRQKRRARYTITLNNGDVFGISEDVFLSSNIAVGDSLNQEQLQDILGNEDISKIKESAYHLLNYRSRSRFELQDRLQKKGYSKAGIQTVIKFLEDQGYIDDRAFIKSFVRDQVYLKKLGPIALKASIMNYRIAPKLVEEEIESIYTKYPKHDLILDLIKKKNIDCEKLMGDKERIKLVNFIKRKGFAWHEIEPVLFEQGLI